MIDKTTLVILSVSSIGFIYLLFKIRISFDKEPSKLLKMFIKKEVKQKCVK